MADWVDNYAPRPTGAYTPVYDIDDLMRGSLTSGSSDGYGLAFVESGRATSAEQRATRAARAAREQRQFREEFTREVASGKNYLYTAADGSRRWFTTKKDASKFAATLPGATAAGVNGVLTTGGSVWTHAASGATITRLS